MEYDLEERLTKFAENIVELCKKVPKNAITLPIIDQLIRSGTGTGANYTEANGASSKKDFKNKIYIAKKEAMETKYWLRIVGELDIKDRNTLDDLSREVQELNLIFATIIRNGQSNEKN